MRHWLKILIVFFILFQVCQTSQAQFWKKKKYHTRSTSGKISRPDKTSYRDAFARKSKKRANIKTRRKPYFKSKKKMRRFSTSRKTKKPGSKKFFKPKYSGAKLKKRSGDSFSRNAQRNKRSSKKGGGNSGGIFKGRKK